MKRRGFTMIELMIVVVVAAVVVGIAIPSFNAVSKRNPLYKGKGMIQDAILDAKVRAATGTSDWRVIFSGYRNTIKSGPLGGIITDVRTLPVGCTFSSSSLSLTYEFFRDGTANSSGGLNEFSIENDRGEAVSFVLVGQIGEVKIGSDVIPGGGGVIPGEEVKPGGVTPGGSVGGVGGGI